MPTVTDGCLGVDKVTLAANPAPSTVLLPESRVVRDVLKVLEQGFPVGPATPSVADGVFGHVEEVGP